MSTMPLHGLDQRHAALRRANEIRGRRAELKRRMKAMGRNGASLEAARLLEELPEFLRTWRVEELIGAVPSIGRIGASRGTRTPTGFAQKKWLREFGIMPTTPLSGVTLRKRRLLAERMRLYADARVWTKYLDAQRQA